MIPEAEGPSGGDSVSPVQVPVLCDSLSCLLRLGGGFLVLLHHLQVQVVAGLGDASLTLQEGSHPHFDVADVWRGKGVQTALHLGVLLAAVNSGHPVVPGHHTPQGILHQQLIAANLARVVLLQYRPLQRNSVYLQDEIIKKNFFH